MFEPASCRFGRDETQQRCEFRTMRLTRQCHPQWQEQIRAFAPGAFLENLGEHFEVGIGLLVGIAGGGEKRRSRCRDDTQLLSA